MSEDFITSTSAILRNALLIKERLPQIILQAYVTKGRQRVADQAGITLDASIDFLVGKTPPTIEITTRIEDALYTLNRPGGQQYEQEHNKTTSSRKKLPRSS